MSKFFLFPITVSLLAGFLLSSCKVKKKNLDLDPSNYKVPKKNNVINSNKDSSLTPETKNKTTISELINYQNKEAVLSSVFLGKKDPFSDEEIKVINMTSDLKLTGFLNTKSNKYAFVSYLGEEGTISEKSIGGINTTLLPNGAKVINIDSKKLQLIINFDRKDYILDLNNL